MHAALYLILIPHPTLRHANSQQQVYTLLCISSVLTSNTVHCISAIHGRQFSISALTCTVRTTAADPLCSLLKYKATASFLLFHYIAHPTSPSPSPLQLPYALTIIPLSLPIITEYARIQHLPPLSIHQPEKHPPPPQNPQSATRCPSSVLANLG